MRRKLGIVMAFIFFIALAIAATSFFFLVRDDHIAINPWFVSMENDTVGVDISHYQGDVDVDRLVSQNVKFAYFKATEGSSYSDEYFAKNWEKAKKYNAKENIYFGAYHFFSFDSDGDAQAENFITTVGDLSGKLVPVVDFEIYGKYKEKLPEKELAVKELKKMLDILENYYHVKPMIYAEFDVYNRFLKDDFAEYPHWIRSIHFPITWCFKGDWTLWQYTDRGELEGYTDEKYIDLSKLNPNKQLNDLVMR